MRNAIFDLDSEPLSGKIARGLARLGMVLKAEGRRVSGSHAVSPTQGQILATLLAKEPEILGISELAEELAVTLPTVSDSVSAMVRKKLLRKTPSHEDGRVNELRLTSAGRTLASEICDWPDFLAQAIGELDMNEQIVLLRGLMKMIRTLQLQGKIPVARICVTCRYFRPNVNKSGSRPHHCDFVNAPIGDKHIRLDCPDHEGASAPDRNRIWKDYLKGNFSQSNSTPNI